MSEASRSEPSRAAPAAGTGVQVPVWDLPTRLFHWLLVAAIIVSWRSAKEGHMDVHELSGQVILTLLVFRVLWGVVGSTTARFTHFVKGPRAVLDHARELFRRTGKTSFGHNPLGALSVLALLAAVAAQAGTGLYADDDIFFRGPLAGTVSKETSDYLTGLHKHVIFDVLVALIVLHLAAVAHYRFFKREKLVKAMITGRKEIPEGTPVPPLRFVHPLWAVPVLALSGAAVWWVTA